MYNAHMEDDDHDFAALDPAKLLPFPRILEESSPDANKLAPQFIAGSDDQKLPAQRHRPQLARPPRARLLHDKRLRMRS
jgi:hypothetical protein